LGARLAWKNQFPADGKDFIFVAADFRQWQYRSLNLHCVAEMQCGQTFFRCQPKCIADDFRFAKAMRKV
jgi:hypothetical protein